MFSFNSKYQLSSRSFDAACYNYLHPDEGRIHFIEAGEGKHIHVTKRSFASVMWSAEKCTWGQILLSPMCFEFDTSSEFNICDIVTLTQHFLISADQAIPGSDPAVTQSRCDCHVGNGEESWNPFDDMKRMFVCACLLCCLINALSTFAPFVVLYNGQVMYPNNPYLKLEQDDRMGPHNSWYRVTSIPGFRCGKCNLDIWTGKCFIKQLLASTSALSSQPGPCP